MKCNVCHNDIQDGRERKLRDWVNGSWAEYTVCSIECHIAKLYEIIERIRDKKL